MTSIASPPTGKRPTMVDVAREAGVSLKTVSRVVNGESSVGDATAEKVRVAIELLGYRRNDLARSLRPGQRTGLVGFVIADIGNPFYSSIARAVERAEPDLRVVIASTEEDQYRERELVADLIARGVDALIVFPSQGDASYLDHEVAAGTPVVCVDRPPVGCSLVDTVVLDNRGGAAAAIHHLFRHGHRRVAFLGDDPHEVSTSAQRLAGYRSAHEEASIPVETRLIRVGSHDARQAESLARALLLTSEPPTAVFCTNNRNTVGALRAIRALAPDTALVGFDDVEFADLLDPPLTVVTYDLDRMGLLAAERLLQRLEHGHDMPAVHEVVPTVLVPRGSGEIPPPP